MMFLTRGKITLESRWCGTKDSETISEPTVLPESNNQHDLGKVDDFL